MSRRKTFATELVCRSLDVFLQDSWTLRRCLTVNPDDPNRALATCDVDRRIITIYPKLIGRGDDPLAKSLIHELVGHLLLQYGGSLDDEKAVGWWERSIWRNLPSDLKDRLRRMVDEEEPREV